MMSARHTASGIFALALSLSLAGCDDGTGGSDASGKSDAGSQVDDILAIDDGDEGLLGSVNLPRPDWIPTGMPLPKDAHIYLATHIQRDGEPDIFMLQARSFVEAKSYADAFYDWAKGKNLKPELADKPGVNTKLVGFTGAGDSTAMTQVISRDGYRDIVISFAGPL